MTLASPRHLRRWVILVAFATALLLLGGSIWISAASKASGAGASAGGETTCIPSLTTPFRSPAYANTPWPTEHADTWRTHAAPTGLPSGIRRYRLVTKSE